MEAGWAGEGSHGAVEANLGPEGELGRGLARGVGGKLDRLERLVRPAEAAASLHLWEGRLRGRRGPPTPPTATAAVTAVASAVAAVVAAVGLCV